MESLNRIRSCFSRHMNHASIMPTTTRNYFWRTGRAHSSRNTNFVFMVSALLSFLQVKGQGQDDSPFRTHPKTINVAIASLLMYGLAYDFEDRFASIHPVCANVFRRSLALFGSLLVASLGSFLFPDSIRPILYLVYVVLYADELMRWLQRRVGVGIEEIRTLPV